MKLGLSVGAAAVLLLALAAPAGILRSEEGTAPTPAPPSTTPAPAPAPEPVAPPASPPAASSPAAPNPAEDASSQKSEPADPRALAILNKAKSAMKIQPPRFGRSPHYMMMTDSTAEPVCRSVLSLAEQYRSRFAEYWAGKVELAIPKDRGWVIIFADHYVYRYQFGAGEKAVASPEPLVNGIALSIEGYSKKQEAYEALRYACFAHLVENLLLDTKDATGSVWVVQGLGNFFALTPGIDTEKPEFGRIQMSPDRREFAYRKMLAEYGGRVTLSDLLEDKQVKDFTESQFLYQASCWSFVHFLMQGDGEAGRKLVQGYVAKVRGGSKGFAAFVSLLGDESLSSLEEKWRRYVQKTITR